MTEPWVRPTHRRFTLHVDFVAVDEMRAHSQADAYVQGLGQLRPEVDTHTARMSVEGDWSRSTPVFCGAPGPDVSDVCVDGTGHPGLHQGPGASRRWTDDEVPRAPDNAGDLG